jgi:hypothetical protein
VTLFKTKLEMKKLIIALLVVIGIVGCSEDSIEKHKNYE